MAELRGVEVLQSEIEKAKDKLRGYNENIKKLTGRDPTRPGVRRMLSGEGSERNEDGYPNRTARGRGRLFGMARRGIVEDSAPPAKRRVVGGAFSRLGPAPVPARRRDREDSPYEEELPHKLSVHSSVVATSRDAKNRQDILQEQTKDKEGMQRNRRMFGLLLGTLNKFKTESKTLQTKEVQRKKIEEKLEENAEKEKRKFKQETKLLMEEMHLEQSKISRLQQKMEMVQEHAEREEEMKKLYNFIATKTKPRIFWRPQQMSSLVDTKMKESKKVVDDMLEEGHSRLEKEIQELMDRENKREERIKMRLREDGLFGEGEDGNEEEDKVVGEGEGERTVVDAKEGNLMSRRLGKRIEDFGSDEENEDANDRDAKKRPRRTVVVENEKRENSESGSEDDMPLEGEEVSVSDDRRQSRTVDDNSGKKMAAAENGSSSSDEEKAENSKRHSEEHKKKDSDRKRKISTEGREKSKESDGDRHKGEERESHRDKRDRREDRKERKRENRDDSVDSDRHKRRRNDDKGSKKDKERDGHHSHREGRKEKRERRDSYGDTKKHSSKHSKDKRRDSDNDIQIKQEKEDRDAQKNNASDSLSHSRVVDRDREEEENREGNSTAMVTHEEDADQEPTTPTEA